MSTLSARIGQFFADVPGRERRLLAAAMVLAVLAVVMYVLTTRSHSLAGDEIFYNEQARFFAEGKLWWSTSPFDIPHPSAWKAPGYGAWAGFWYALTGNSAVALTLVQSLLAAVTVFLTWLLARRLFGPRAAIVAAFGVAVFPLAFEYYGLLFPEALAIPLTMLVAVLVIGRTPTNGLVVATGVAMGLSLLVRPTAFFLFAGIAAAWVVASGWRRGLGLAAGCAVIAALVVAPWTIRNALTEEVGLIPISVQDGAAYGTFNESTAADSDNPWAWRAFPRDYEQVVRLDEPTSDAEFRSRMQDAAFEYIKDHPTSLAKAFWWNGIRRFWDLRSPSSAINEVAFQGRSEVVRGVGLGMYYLVLPLALAGLWRVRRRAEILAPALALAIAASLAFTVIAGTRYRAPLEPLLVILAASLLAPAAWRSGGRRSPAE